MGVGLRGFRVTGSTGDFRGQRRAADQMIGETCCVTDIEVAVPNAVGIDDRVGTVEARSEATARCDEWIGRAACDQLHLDRGYEGRAARRAACGFSARPRIRAHEQVPPRHESTMSVSHLAVKRLYFVGRSA